MVSDQGHAIEADSAQCASRDRQRLLRERALIAVSEIADPELPVVTIADLGILRDVRINGDEVEVVITPTYSGCPAMTLIRLEIDLALEKAGFTQRRIATILSPAWTSDWISEEGRRKLASYGVAPPARRAYQRALFSTETVACPRCGSTATETLSEFGSTSCKALRRCTDCLEPFDYFKCI